MDSHGVHHFDRVKLRRCPDEFLEQGRYTIKSQEDFGTKSGLDLVGVRLSVGRPGDDVVLSYVDAQGVSIWVVFGDSSNGESDEASSGAGGGT